MDLNNGAVMALRTRFGDSVTDVVEFRNEVTLTVEKGALLEICRFLKEDLGYDLLEDVTAVDYLGRSPRFMMVYHVYSIPARERIRIKAAVDEGDPSVDSLTPVWRSANWLEREVYDLFGITFKDHPDLRRILMPADWVGHPLRKDYPLQGPDREPYKGRLS